MKPGTDFVQRIERELTTAAAVVVVIGESWLDVTDSEGRRRLELPNDYVRFEIASGLREEKPVIPLLVDGARMPSRDELPADLAKLADRNALELIDRYWKWGMNALIDALEELVGKPESEHVEREATSSDPQLSAEAREEERKRFTTVAAVADFLGRCGVDIRGFNNHVVQLLAIRDAEPLLDALIAAKPDMTDLSGRGPFQLGQSVTPGLLVATPTRLIYIVQGWKLRTFQYEYDRLAHVAINRGRWRDDLLVPKWYDVLNLRVALYSGEATMFRMREDRWRERALSFLDIIHGRTPDGVVELEVQPSR